MVYHHGFSLFESVFPVLFFLIFGLVFGVIIWAIVKGISGSHRDSISPVLTVEAWVASRRHMVRNDWTIYFVTFQYPSGDRAEFKVSGEEFGMLVEGDYGKLTFQGSRYLGFVREGINTN